MRQSSRSQRARSRTSGVCAAQLFEQPRLRDLPIPHDGLWRHCQRLGGLLYAQASEKSQFYDTTSPGVDLGQALKRIIEREQIAVLLNGEQIVREGYLHGTTASLLVSAGT